MSILLEDLFLLSIGSRHAPHVLFSSAIPETLMSNHFRLKRLLRWEQLSMALYERPELVFVSPINHTLSVTRGQAFADVVLCTRQSCFANMLQETQADLCLQSVILQNSCKSKQRWGGTVAVQHNMWGMRWTSPMTADNYFIDIQWDGGDIKKKKVKGTRMSQTIGNSLLKSHCFPVASIEQEAPPHSPTPTLQSSTFDAPCSLPHWVTMDSGLILIRAVTGSMEVYYPQKEHWQWSSAPWEV